MAVYYKIGGTWTKVARPYVRKADVWRGAQKVWMKRSGAWQQIYLYDVTPPPPPVVQLDLVETTRQGDRIVTPGGAALEESPKISRHIKISVKMPIATPDLKRIRVLTTYNGKAPTTQYGGTYVQQADESYPNEPWSEYHFHGFGSSGENKDETVWKTKTWPRNADKNSNLSGPEVYYFTAWAEDFNGNWSVATSAQIFVPKKNVEGTDLITREARFQPINSGTVDGSGFKSGVLTQNGSPRKRGIWLYQNQFDLIGARGKPTIRKAQILIQRLNDDGRENANLYIYWHTYPGGNAIPTNGQITQNQAAVLGKITKGQTKWFTLPDAMHDALEKNQIKGFGLSHKDPQKATYAANDYSVIQSTAASLRSGEVHVVWNERP